MDNKTVVYAHNLLANNSTSFVTLPPDFGYARLREEKKVSMYAAASQRGQLLRGSIPTVLKLKST